MRYNLFKMMKRILVLGVLLLNVIASPSFAWSDWKTLKTEHFTVFYKKGLEAAAWSALEGLETQRARIEALTGNEKKYVNVVVEDIGRLTNGLTDPMVGRIRLFTNPPGEGELQFEGNSMMNLTAHEYTHMLQITKVGGMPWLLTQIFGNTFYPNIVLPLWGLEGIAVFSESDYSPYAGRLNDGYFSSFIASRAREKNLPKITDASFMPFEYPFKSGAYIYGGEFYKYLAGKYGKDKFAVFFRQYGKRVPVLEIDRSVADGFGKAFPALWEDWREASYARYSSYEMEGEKLTDHGWLVEQPVLGDGKLYYSSGYPVKTRPFTYFWASRIVERDLGSGKETAIVESALAHDVLYRNIVGSLMKFKKGKLYYLEDDIKPGFANDSNGTYGIVKVLHRRDAASGKDESLFVDGIRAFSVDEDGRIVYSVDRKGGFGSTIMTYSPGNRSVAVLGQSEYLIDDISISGGKAVVSARKENSNYSLCELNMSTGSIEALTATGFYEGMPLVTGETLYYGANYGGSHRIYKLDGNSGKIFSLTENGYADSPAPDEQSGDLYYVGLTPKGFDIYRKKLTAKEFEPPLNSNISCGPSPLDRSKVKEGGYADTFSSMWPYMRLPLAYYDGNSALGGMFFNGQDPLDNFTYRALALYDGAKQRMASRVTLSTNYLTPLYASLTYDDITERKTELNMYYPLMSRITEGFSNFWLGVAASSLSGGSRKQIEPYSVMGLRFPRTLLNLSFSMPVERMSLGSDIHRTAFLGRGDVIRLEGENEISATLLGYYDPENPSTVFPVLRGYTAALPDKEGGVFSGNISRNIFKIRWGAWREAFYLEDVIGVIFYDNAFSKSGNTQSSYGAELHLEFKTVVNADLGLRYAVNREGQASSTFLFQAYLPFDLGEKPSIIRRQFSPRAGQIY